MDLGLDPAQRELAVIALAAVSVFCAIVVVSWPYLVRDTLDERMRQVASERERLRRQQRRRLNPEKQAAGLRREPRKLLGSIVKRFGLVERTAVGEVRRMLQRAGYRGEAALMTFLAVRLIAPPAMFAVALLYLLYVLKLALPLAATVGIAALGGALGYYVPAVYVRNRTTKRQEAILRAWPDALDLLLICVESGMGIESALRRVSEEIGVQSVALAEEMMLTTAELSFLQDRRQAYDNLSDRTGLDAVKAVVASLKQAEKHGTSLGRSLRVLSQENRDLRLARAEKKAAALPPKLTVPMILFFLPVLFAVIIAPAAIQITSMK